MATISITVPDAVVPRVQSAFSLDGVNPATVAQVKAAIQDFVRRRLQVYEGAAAANTARTQAEAQVTADLGPMN